MATSTKNFDPFILKLSSAINQQNRDQNVFFAPTSIALAMAMCAVGGRHETLDQMLTAFEVSSKEELTDISNNVVQVFSNANGKKPPAREPSNSYGPPDPIVALAPNVTPLTLRVVNCLYVQQGFEVKQKYIDLLKQSFLSVVDMEDFQNQSAQVVEKINGWVERRTNRRICNLLSTEEVTPLTQCILLNCIYFKGEWLEQFKESNTDKNATFYKSNGSKSTIALMHQIESFNYAENKDLRVQIAHIPYKSLDFDSLFVFTIVLPQEGVQLEEVERKLMSNLSLRQNALNYHEAESKELSLYVPKFRVETKYVLNDIMQSLGIVDAFDSKKANFRNIIGKVTDDNCLAITKVIHKTFINVDENGTEAAAASAVVMTRFTAMFQEKPKPIEFKANRPFLFFIQEAQRNITLFSGKFISP